MRRELRLRSSDDFKRVRGTGVSYAGPLLVLFVADRPDTDAPVRVGISAGRRVGGAVVRNRVRRQVTEAVRARHALLKKGFDIVFVARQAAAGVPSDRIEEAVAQLLEQAGLCEVSAPCAG